MLVLLVILVVSFHRLTFKHFLDLPLLVSWFLVLSFRFPLQRDDATSLETSTRPSCERRGGGFLYFNFFLLLFLQIEPNIAAVFPFFLRRKSQFSVWSFRFLTDVCSQSPFRGFRYRTAVQSSGAASAAISNNGHTCTHTLHAAYVYVQIGAQSCLGKS